MTGMTAGEVVTISPAVRRVLAPNPGVMTGPGTNTYLVGSGAVAVIDPGPDDDAHLDVVADAVRGRCRWILVTHTHSDHSPGAAGLRDRLGDEVEVLGHSARDGFTPDREIGDGFVLEGDGFRLQALHTPGHAANHLCYLLEEEELLFSGDHIMSGSTVVIGPPDGDMGAYLMALERLRTMPLGRIAPGHGAMIEDPAAKIDEYITHRLARERAVASALESAGRATVEELVPAVYTDVPESLHAIARYSLWAHLRKLAADGQAAAADPDDLGTVWEPLNAG